VRMHRDGKTEVVIEAYRAAPYLQKLLA